jgi:DNA-binding MarR family transcriptional regulator
VADKIVVRQAPADDRRAIIVQLTPRGLKQFTAMARRMRRGSMACVEFDAGEADT